MKWVILLFFFLGCLFSPSASFAHAFTEDFPTPDISQLEFTTASYNKNLAVAEDRAGYTWIRGHIPSELMSLPIVLRIPSARIHDYHLYLPQDGQLTHFPRNMDSHSAQVKSRFPQYTFIPNDSVYYIAIGEHQPQTVQVQLQEQDQFSSTESFHLFRVGLYYGLALMSVIVNLVFYLIFRDKRFITYCILLLTTFISFFYEDGMFYYFSDGRWTMDDLTVWNSSFTAIIAVSFTYYFLGLESVLRPYRKVYFTASAFLLLGALAYTLTRSNLFYHGVLSTCFLFALTCLYLAIQRFRHDVYARFLLLSFGLVVITGVLYVFYTRIDSSTYALFDIGTFRMISALEIIAISFAIIFKIRALQHQNDRYRQELDNYLKALEVKAADHYYHQNRYSENASSVSTKDELADGLKAQYELTDREIEVLLCIWEGLTNKEIAQRLCITVSTAKYHVSNLYVKLDVKNRNQVQVLRDLVDTA